LSYETDKVNRKASAQEAVELWLVAGFADGQKKMTLLWLALHYRYFDAVPKILRDAQLEEFTVAIPLNVHGVVG